jgi:transcriptional regulator with XRE-family HTH domain
VFLEELGRRIRERREIRGLKQIDIANALQISAQAVSKWERGENAPDITVVGSLARILGVTTDWILGCQDAPGDDFEASHRSPFIRTPRHSGTDGRSRLQDPRLGSIDSKQDWRIE